MGHNRICWFHEYLWKFTFQSIKQQFTLCSLDTYCFRSMRCLMYIMQLAYCIPNCPINWPYQANVHYSITLQTIRKLLCQHQFKWKIQLLTNPTLRYAPWQWLHYCMKSTLIDHCGQWHPTSFLLPKQFTSRPIWMSPYCFNHGKPRTRSNDKGNTCTEINPHQGPIYSMPVARPSLVTIVPFAKCTETCWCLSTIQPILMHNSWLIKLNNAPLSIHPKT